MKLWKWTPLPPVMVFFAYAMWWMGMNYTGYCHAKNRYLSEQEKVEAGIQFVLDGYPPSLQFARTETINGVAEELVSWKIPEYPVRYKNAVEFKALNPACCELVKVINVPGEGIIKHSILDRLSGFFSDFVIIKFKVRYVDDGQEKNADSSMSVSIANCGKAWSMF